MSKRSTLKLGIENSAGSDEVVALATTESELRVCLILNDLLSIQLTLSSDITIQQKGESIPFRRYQFEDAEGIEKYTLIVNRNGGQILFRELKHVDYLLVITTDDPSVSATALVAKLKSAKHFTAISTINPEKLKQYARIRD